MSPSVATFLFESANFVLLAGALGWLFFRPVRAAIERRRDEIAEERRAADQARGEADRAVETVRAQQSALEASLEERRAQMRRAAEREAEQLLADARALAQRERAALQQELVGLRRARAASLAVDAAFAARELVARLLDLLRGPDLDQLLTRAACRVLAVQRRSGSLEPIVIESARPLDDGVLADLAKAAGVGDHDAAARVDPALIAGLRVLTSRGLVDVSASGLAAHAERALARRLDEVAGE